MLLADTNLPTEELQALDAAHHIHPFTDTGALNAKGARVITRADGVFLWDSDGNQMLDAMAGLWCVNVGYGRKSIADAVARQMERLPYYNTFFQTTHPPAIALAKTVADLAPDGFNRVFFGVSGSDANDTNLRMARHYWASLGKPEKTVIIGRNNSYHGSTVGAVSLGGMTAMRAQGGIPVADIEHIDQPYWYGEGGETDPNEFGLERARQLETAIERIGPDRVAAFIAEPIQGAGGVIIPPDSYWPEIQRICDAYDILLIADEVICGFGRTGEWFGSTYYGIKPDMMTIAKGLSSGYLPIGGTIVGDRVATVLEDKGGEFIHGYTYSGHPASCAAALENLRILQDEKIVENVKETLAPYLREKWLGLADHPIVGEARIVGMFGALELTPHKASRARFKGESGAVGLMCREFCFENGLVMRAVGDSMIISPPLVIAKAEIDQFIALAVKALDLTHAKLKADGMMVAA
jgi:putrescine aminotransferase